MSGSLDFRRQKATDREIAQLQRAFRELRQIPPRDPQPAPKPVPPPEPAA
jgi:hypothetical protein